MEKFENSRVINKEQRKLKKKHMDRWKRELEKKRPVSEDREPSKGVQTRRSAWKLQEKIQKAKEEKQMEEKPLTPPRPRMSFSSPFDYWDSDESDVEQSPSPPETDDQLNAEDLTPAGKQRSPSDGSDNPKESDDDMEDSETTQEAVEHHTSSEESGIDENEELPEATGDDEDI